MTYLGILFRYHIIYLQWKNMKNTLNIEHNGLADIPRKQDGTLSKRECRTTGISERIHATGQTMRGCDPLERHRRKHLTMWFFELCRSQRGQFTEALCHESFYQICLFDFKCVFLFHSTLETLGMPLFCSNIISCQPILQMNLWIPASPHFELQWFLRKVFCDPKCGAKQKHPNPFK